MKFVLQLAAVLLVIGLVKSLSASPQEVNIYSYRQPFLIKPMLDEFTKETGIKVNIVFAKKGMVERIKREGRNSPADVLLTVDIGRLTDAVKAGVLQPVQSAKLLANVPVPYRHPEGLWYAQTLRGRVIFASKERVRPGELSSYEDLATAKWKGRICTRSSQHQYNVALLASIIAHHGEAYAERWARGVKENLARKPQGNDRAQVKAIKEGECDIALANTYYMGKMQTNPKQKAWADAVTLFFPNQEGRGTHMNVSGAGVTKSAPNKANAVKLLEFLTGAKAQRMYAEVNHEYPVNPGVAWSSRVASWGRFKRDSLPLEQIAKHRSTAIRIFDRVGYP